MALQAYDDANALEDGEPAEGLLLDVDPVAGEDGTDLRLWVKLRDEVAAVRDPDFDPYFYVVPEDGADVDALRERLLDLEVDGVAPREAALVDRGRGLGDDPVPVVQVTARHPGDVPTIREAAARVTGASEVLEADVPFHYRYLVDKDLRPVDGIRFTARRTDRGWEARDPEAVEREETDLPLDLMAFDLEVHNPHVTPKAERDPIVLVGVATGDGRTEVLRADEEDGEADDEALIRAFVDLVDEEDPDVLLTYNGDGFDFPYLRDRADEHGIDLPLGRDGSEPDFRRFGRNPRVEMVGRANVDLFRVAERDLPGVKVQTLERVAEHLGLPSAEDRADVPGEEIAEYWDDPDRREELVDYAEADVRSTLEMGERLLPQQVAFARMTKQSLTDVTKIGRGRQVDWFLVDEARRRDLLVPNRGGAGGEAVEGGFVMEPPDGLHEDVQALDFSSMYPSIMIAYNISPDTVVEDGADEDVHEAPEVGHRFRKEPPGFFRALLEDLTDRRDRCKERLADVPEGSDEARLLDIRQRSLKVLTNSFYGYMGWNQARWHSRPCAEATTAWGRHLIKEVIGRAEDEGIEVMYGDTDSLFVRRTPDVPAFVDEVNQELPLELEAEERYEVIFFTGKKKRYAGLTAGGDIVVKGLEVRRGDWCDLAKGIQQGVLETVLRDRDPEGAAETVKETVEDLRAGQAPVEDLTIHKTLTKHPDNYEAKQAHVLAVEAAAEDNPDFHVPVGAQVGYVILDERVRTPDPGDGLASSGGRVPNRGDPNLSERAKLVEYLDDSDTIDAVYYIDKQVVPAALRVLGHFGYDQDELKGRPSQHTLGDF
jgi:DNA polymerase I